MHIYQDVSHFRAPYKSLLSVAGFGDDAASSAAAAANAAVATATADPNSPGTAAATVVPTSDQVNAVAPIGPDGIRRYTPDTSAQIMSTLEQWVAMPQSADDFVKVAPYTQAQLTAAQTDPVAAAALVASSAATWARARNAAGYAVYAPITLIWPTSYALSTGIYMGSTPASDSGQMQTVSQLPTGAYLLIAGDAASSGGTNWLEDIAIVAGITVALGLGFWAFKKYGKRGGPLGGKLAVPNRRRHARRHARRR